MRESLVILAPRSIAFALAILCCNRIEIEAGNPLSRWSWRHPVPQGLYLSGVTYGNGRFVAVGWADHHRLFRWAGMDSGGPEPIPLAALGDLRRGLVRGWR